MGGGGTSPTLAGCLCFNALVIGWNKMDSELHATEAIVPTGA
jgi:hypothetical protein